MNAVNRATTFLIICTAFTADACGAGHWPAWRGPIATGVAPDADPPLVWGETKNIAWKVPLPGRGHSTPIV